MRSIMFNPLWLHELAGRTIATPPAFVNDRQHFVPAIDSGYDMAHLSLREIKEK